LVKLPITKLGQLIQKCGQTAHYRARLIASKTRSNFPSYARSKPQKNFGQLPQNLVELSITELGQLPQKYGQTSHYRFNQSLKKALVNYLKIWSNYALEKFGQLP